MKRKLLLLAFAVFILVRVNAAITVTINAPTQYQVVVESININVTVNNSNILNHDSAYVKVSVLGRITKLVWTGVPGNNYKTSLYLNDLPPVDTLVLIITAIGFNSNDANDTAVGTVIVIHDIRPIISMHFVPSKYIATPNLRVVADCRTYTGAPCHFTILKKADSSVLATGVNIIDTLVNCAPTKQYDTLLLTADDGLSHTAVNKIGYYYEPDKHFKPIYVADGERVGDIIDYNHGNVLTAERDDLYQNEYYFYNMVTDSGYAITALPPQYGLFTSIHEIYAKSITERGLIYNFAATIRQASGDQDDFIGTGENIKGVYSFYGERPSSFSLALYRRGDNYIADEAGGITNVNTGAHNFSIYVPNWPAQKGNSLMVVSNNRVAGLKANDSVYYYSPQYGSKVVGKAGVEGLDEFYASGNNLFYLSKSGNSNIQLNSFDGVTNHKIADVGNDPEYYIVNWNEGKYIITARDGYAVFNISGAGQYITDGATNTRPLAGQFEAIGDDGNISCITAAGRTFFDKHGDSLLTIDNIGKALFAKGKWYVAYANVLYSIDLAFVLPSSLTQFTGINKGNTNLLTWQTAQEVNTAYFELQQATITNRNFTALTTVTAAGNSNTQQNYNYTHTSPQTGTNYYRLKMVDKDGKFTFSRIISINNGEATFKAAVLPNLVHNNITLQIQTTNTQNVRVDVVNVNGVVLLSKQFAAGSGITTQTIATTSLAKGAYFVRVTGGNNAQVNLKAIKQ